MPEPKPAVFLVCFSFKFRNSWWSPSSTLQSLCHMYMLPWPGYYTCRTHGLTTIHYERRPSMLSNSTPFCHSVHGISSCVWGLWGALHWVYLTCLQICRQAAVRMKLQPYLTFHHKYYVVLGHKKEQTINKRLAWLSLRSQETHTCCSNIPSSSDIPLQTHVHLWGHIPLKGC